jgi:DNA processing protein
MSLPRDGGWALHALALACVPRVGARKYRELVDHFGDGASAFAATIARPERELAIGRARKEMDAAAACGARIILIGGPAYPEALRELCDPPPVLFAIGDLRVLEPPLVAIVGTRSMTGYGARVVRALSSALASAGASIVSGMALGVDAGAHRAALDAGGRTVAVLGSGVDVPLPRANHALYRAIASRGLVLSEFWCGTSPVKGSFPRRNRVIAGLAQVTFVVEAGARSGALITAEHAGDLHRDVGAIPGPIDAPQSRGTNELLRDGAHVITSTDDALKLVGLETNPGPRGSAIRDGDERTLWEALTSGAASGDELMSRTGLPTNRVLSAISSLELRGLLHVDAHGAIRPSL